MGIGLRAVVKYNRLPAIRVGAERRVKAMAAEQAEDSAQYMRDLMEGPKSGRYYGAHQASAPGEAPAVDTGALIGSIQVEPRGLTVAIAVTDPKAPLLEFGTRFMAPRPYVTPTIEWTRQVWPEKLKSEGVIEGA